MDKTFEPQGTLKSRNSGHFSHNGVILIGLFLSILFLNGCMAGKTRALPFTEFPPPEDLKTIQAKRLTIAVEPFDVSSTVVKGGHHEGLLQVRQPWIWGLSKEQKSALYGDLGNIVRYAFIDELLRRNQRVLLPGFGAISGQPDYKITGTVRSVELNTYGQGTREGFGSAGNYWEAKIELADVALVRSVDNTVLWQGDITQYCKLQNSPVKLDWTIFTVIGKSLQEGLALSKGVTPGGIKKAIETSAADYEVGPIEKNPVEIAARLAALDVLKRIYGAQGGETRQGGTR